MNYFFYLCVIHFRTLSDIHLSNFLMYPDKKLQFFKKLILKFRLNSYVTPIRWKFSFLICFAANHGPWPRPRCCRRPSSTPTVSQMRIGDWESNPAPVPPWSPFLRRALRRNRLLARRIARPSARRIRRQVCQIKMAKIAPQIEI